VDVWDIGGAQMNLREKIANWNIIKHTKIWLIISAAIILVGITSMVVNQLTIGSPLNFGIDFMGGTVITLTCEEKPDVGAVRGILASEGFKDAIIQEAQGNKIFIKIKAETLDNDVKNRIIDGISVNIAKVDTEQIGITSIASVIGNELKKSGLISLALALLFILFYITMRFTFKFGLATIIALLHDVFVTLGLLAIFRIELNAPFIGALLTIITYSVEDSVVVMDRVRENVKFRGKETFPMLVNKSITGVWVRSMNTSITTFFASFALVVFAGPTMRDFSMTLMFGLLAGTYSSIYIASPLLVLWHKGKEKVSSVTEKRVISVESRVETTTSESHTEQKVSLSKKALKKKRGKKSKRKRR